MLTATVDNTLPTDRGFHPMYLKTLPVLKKSLADAPGADRGRLQTTNRAATEKPEAAFFSRFFRPAAFILSIGVTY